MPIFREPGVAAAFDPHALFVNPSATDPTTDNQGDPLIEGAWYYNTASNQLRIYDGSVWADFAAAGGTITGDVLITGTLQVNGDVQLGNGAGDALDIKGEDVTWSNNPTHSGNHIFSGTVTGQSQVQAQSKNLSPFGNKNFLINGGFDYWQRGTSFTTNAAYTADRWQMFLNGTTQTITQQAHTLGQTSVPYNPTFYLRSVVTTSAGAANFAMFCQKIENVRTIANGTITISFYAKADAAKNIAIEVVQSFGSGGSPSSSVYTPAGLVALTTSWAKYTVTIAIPSITGKTLGSNDDDRTEIVFWLDAGSSYNTRASSLGQQSGTFEFSNIQVEIGSYASEFEVLPRALIFDLCHRYYQQYSQGNIGMVQYALNNGITWTPFITRMRAAPSSINISGTTFTNVTTGAFASNQIAANGFTTLWTNTDATNDNGAVTFNWNASAEL